MNKLATILVFMTLSLGATGKVCSEEGKSKMSSKPTDPRNIRAGSVIPSENYADQPYCVTTEDGNWLCVLTTGPGQEGDPRQHVVATISKDKGKSWSDLIDIERQGPPEASWVVPLKVPGGRVYVFYDYNGDKIDNLRGGKIRADMLGWYAYKYSDDNGKTWSSERYRLPMRVTACDRGNDWQGEAQIFWGISKPIIVNQSVYFGFTKLGKYMLDYGEGWFFRSDNVLAENDAAKIQWEMLPEGDFGLRAPEFGSIQEEHNIVSLSDGTLYCVYRTTKGYPCHSYSPDGGRTWTKPEFMTYTPDGRKMKTPRACPKVWRTKSGKFLFWFHNHSGKSFSGRNPAWISGGVEKDGRIHWSQPEILLYDENPNTRMSYPDLIEQEGRSWITETQKTIARVHEVDKTLLEGLWNQGQVKTVSLNGLILSLGAKELQTREVDIPRPLNLEETSGVSLDFWIKFSDLSSGQVVLDSRDPAGRGIMAATTENGTIRIKLDDGKTKAAWDCDPGLLQINKLHHIAVIVDNGPRTISFIVDGVLCDGGDARQHGWGRFNEKMGDVSGAGRLRIAPSLKRELKTLRLYDRHLRTSEAIGNYHAGPSRNE